MSDHFIKSLNPFNSSTDINSISKNYFDHVLGIPSKWLIQQFTLRRAFKDSSTLSEPSNENRI